VGGEISAKARRVSFVALGAVILLFACQTDREPEKGFDRLARQIQEVVVPPATSVETSGTERTGGSARTSWEFRISAWSDYRERVTKQLMNEAGFRTTSENPRSMTLSKKLAADVEVVQIDEIGPGRVRVILTAYAY
jgi:hypothetical protein